MKKLILLLFIPLVSFSQTVEEYYDNGKKIIEKTWQAGEQTLTLIEIKSSDISEFRYYINEKGVEVGVNIYSVRDYGKYFKVDVSVINNSKNRFDFNPNEIDVSVNGDVKSKDKYYAISFDEYNKKVTRRQKSNEFWTAFAQGVGNASAGTTYSNSNSYYSNSYNSGYVRTNTTSYSPALANLQYQQNAENMSSLQSEQQQRMNFINEGYLKNHTLFPNTTLEGYFLINFHNKINDINIILKLGDMEFDFSNNKFN
ncbi:hypothetical protein OAS56_04125 [Flavobacteriaceae bacterium]|jgi:hypothetical protein|nr:hypothetical protein [Flavobacteriaceae bacterium]